MSELALVMHGGGMRGAYGAGAIESLTRLLAPGNFDVVLGTSAGAANAAGMAAGGGMVLREIWTHQLDLSHFIHPFRPRWITDTDYLIHICEAQGITNASIRNAPLRILLAVTHYHTGATHYFSNQDDVLSVMHASVSMPVLCRTPIFINGEPYLDGGITASTTDLIKRALAEGATRVVALDLSSPVQWFSRIGLQWYARNKRGGLRAAIMKMIDAPYPEPVDTCDGRVYLIRPLHLAVSRITRAPFDLTRAYEMGVRETIEDEKLRQFLNK